MQFVLFFFLFFTLLSDKNEKRFCNKDLVETYNLTSSNDPKSIDMYLCPALTSSCCSIYDQYMIYNQWKNEYRARLIKYHEGIFEKIKDLRDMITEVLSLDFDEFFRTSPLKQREKQLGKVQLEILKKEDIFKTFNMLSALEGPLKAFMVKLRSSFFCNICDFKNHYYIREKEQKIIMNFSSCENIANGTINYSYVMNVNLVRFLWKLSRVIGLFLTPQKIELLLTHQRKVQAQVRSCASTYIKEGRASGQACKKYCEYYYINGNSPVLEGYQVYFGDYINFLKKFFITIGKPFKPSRILQQRPKSLQKISDTYQEIGGDPIYTDYFINKMINFNDFYEYDRKKGYINFIQNKYLYFDVSRNMQDPFDKGLYKLAAQKRVSLENFTTKVEARGMDLYKHVKFNNMEGSLIDMISELKLKTHFKIYYEKLDPTLVSVLNDFEDDDFKNFHQDNYMLFKNYSDELLRDQLLANPEQLKDFALKRGYNFKQFFKVQIQNEEISKLFSWSFFFLSKKKNFF